MFATLTAILTGAMSLIHVVRAVLPDVIALADDVHAALPAGTSTEQKLAHIETVLRASLAVANELPASVDQVVPVLLDIVAGHLLGKADPAPAPAPEAAQAVAVAVAAAAAPRPVPASPFLNQA